MEANLTGFDLLTFVNGGFVQFEFQEDGDFNIFVRDELAEYLTNETGIEITGDQLVKAYEQFAQYLATMKLTITPSENGE